MKVQFSHLGVDCELTAVEGARREVRLVGRRARTVRARPSRLFVDEAGEDVLEGFAKRTSRPVALWRSFAAAGLERAFGDLPVSLVWDAYAGCGMCRCSPGFFLVRDGARQVITDEGIVAFSSWPQDAPRYDVWVEIGAKVTPVTAEAVDRADQLAASLRVPETV